MVFCKLWECLPEKQGIVHHKSDLTSFQPAWQRAKEMSITRAAKLFCCLPRFLTFLWQGNDMPLSHAALVSYLMEIGCRVGRTGWPSVQRDAFWWLRLFLSLCVFVPLLCTGR